MKYRVLLIGLLLVPACKPHEQESDTKSLENFVAAGKAKVIQNSCSGPYVRDKSAEGDEFINSPDQYQASVNSVLSSIPVTLRGMFSGPMLGMITVSDAEVKLCSSEQGISENRLSSENDLDLRACLHHDGKGPGVQIILPENLDSIRHSLIRTYFHAAFAVMAHADFLEEQGLFVQGKKDPTLLPAIDEVAIALLLDMKRVGSDAERLAEIFTAQVANSNSPALVYRTLPENKREEIALYVAAEAADQYYCSAETRKVMRSTFKETYRAFKREIVNPLHQAFDEKNPEQLLNELGSELVTVDSELDQGLSLVRRRWAPGRIARSRVSARRQGGRGFFPRANLNARQAGFNNQAQRWRTNRQSARRAVFNSGRPAQAWAPFPQRRARLLGVGYGRR